MVPDQQESATHEIIESKKSLNLPYFNLYIEVILKLNVWSNQRIKIAQRLEWIYGL